MRTRSLFSFPSSFVVVDRLPERLHPLETFPQQASGEGWVPHHLLFRFADLLSLPLIYARAGDSSCTRVPLSCFFRRFSLAAPSSFSSRDPGNRKSVSSHTFRVKCPPESRFTLFGVRPRRPSTKGRIIQCANLSPPTFPPLDSLFSPRCRFSAGGEHHLDLVRAHFPAGSRQNALVRYTFSFLFHPHR